MKFQVLIPLIPAVKAALVVETVFQTAYVTVVGNYSHFNLTQLNSTNTTTANTTLANTTALNSTSSSIPLTSLVVTTSPEYIAPAVSSSSSSLWVAPVESTSSSEAAAAISAAAYNAEPAAVESVVAVTTSSTPAAAAAVVVTTSSTTSSEVYVAPTTTSTTSTTPTTSSSTTSTTAAAADSTSLSAIAVAYHNKVRALHGASDVTWSDTLAAYASNYLANSGCVFAHSGGDYGENIAWGYSDYESAMEAWYIEYKLYDFNNPGYSEATGHFTQMVWKSTTQIGCASINCSGSTFFACEYNPAGNYIGQFASEVS